MVGTGHAALSARIGLIGDVHAEDARLEVALGHLRAEGVDCVLCTGDLVDGAGDVARACKLLRDANAIVVRGNHDRWILGGSLRTLPDAHLASSLDDATKQMVASLPATASLDVRGGRLLLCHGVGANDMIRLKRDTFGYDLQTNDELIALLADPSITFMVGGHTHEPMVRSFARDDGAPLVVVNAGTLARRDGSGFALLDIDERSVSFYAIDDALGVGAPRIERF